MTYLLTYKIEGLFEGKTETIGYLDVSKSTLNDILRKSNELLLRDDGDIIFDLEITQCDEDIDKDIFDWWLIE